LKFNRSFEKVMREGGSMQSCGTVDGSAALPKAAPFLLRLVSKLVLEVLPASLASMIGAMLLAHYHFAQPALLAGDMPAVAPASPEMIRLVRDEHDLIRDFVVAQQAAQKSRYAAADAADAQSERAGPDAALAAAALRRAAAVVAAKSPAATPKAVAATHAPAPLALAGLQDNAAPPPPTAPAHDSLVATTLAVKDHVVHATLHAVMAIGGIPSWIGHRLGSDDLGAGEPTVSAAS
jgi:hypothetical protein